VGDFSPPISPCITPVSSPSWPSSPLIFSGPTSPRRPDPCDPISPFSRRFLRTKEAAEFLSLSARTLEKHRTYGTGPAYRKLGGRVVYAVDDLEAWAARGAVTSTSDPRGSVLPAKRHTPVPLAQAAQRTLIAGAPKWRRGSPDRSADSSTCSGRSRATSRRDAQDLMAYPFFSLSKSHRIAPIDFAPGACRSASRPCPITAWRPSGMPTS
jgi:predicted DNA-binding transcriptional regulator AlpA